MSSKVRLKVIESIQKTIEEDKILLAKVEEVWDKLCLGIRINKYSTN